MTKERIILAFVASLTGIIIASSIFYFYQKKGASIGTTSPQTTPTPVSENGNGMLEIESPENESITDKKTIEIKGKTSNNALLVIATNTDDFVITASSDGAFSQKLDLSENENFITVTSYPENGASTSKELLITYTQEEF